MLQYRYFKEKIPVQNVETRMSRDKMSRVFYVEVFYVEGPKCRGTKCRWYRMSRYKMSRLAIYCRLALARKVINELNNVFHIMRAKFSLEWKTICEKQKIHTIRVNE